MEIPVLVEELPNKRFRARCGEPFGLSAEGDTHAEAMLALNSSLLASLGNGIHLDLIRVPVAKENPWIEGAGCLKDDPFFDEWIAAIHELRTELDASALS